MRVGRRSGFTLIELLIVVVIIGILAAIAVPKFFNTKNKAYVAAMKSDLRNLVSVQENYFSDNNGTYAPDVPSLGTIYRPSAGVTITIGGVSASAWQATATHIATTSTCAISMGGGSTTEGAPVCP